MIYTYLIQSKVTQSYYTGISQNPIKRLREHNSGKFWYTARFKPYVLVYTKAHDNYLEARKHEKWLKKKNRHYKKKLAQLAPPL